MKWKAAPRSLIGSFLIGGLLALAALPATAQPRGQQNFALPSDVIAREIAFARMAREKGQWKAFREFSTDDAQIFASGKPVRLHEWSKTQREPADPVQWKTHAVWMSCDGALAASYGAWEVGKAHGWFSTLWQRQKKGDYRFILDQGDDTPQAIPEPDWIDAKVADCPARTARTLPTPALPTPATPSPKGPVDHLTGESPDKSLVWATTLNPDGSHDYALSLKAGGALREVLRRHIAAVK